MSSQINAVKKANQSPRHFHSAKNAYAPKRQDLGEDSVDISPEALALSSEENIINASKVININPEDIIDI